MFTEEEANTKWCPFARVGFSGAAGNRYSMDIDKSKASAFAVCIGSSCMAWRKAYRVELPEGAMVPITKETGGYCGLVGEP